jgi:hypothetical protein
MSFLPAHSSSRWPKIGVHFNRSVSGCRWMKGGGHVTADECLRRHPPWAKLRRNAPPFRAIAMTPDNRFNRPAQIILRHSFASIANDLGFAEVTIAALVGDAKGSVMSNSEETSVTAKTRRSKGAKLDADTGSNLQAD